MYDKVEKDQYYLNQADPAWQPGEGFHPNLFTPIDLSSFAVVFNAGPGAISYCVISRHELLGSAGFLLLIAAAVGAGCEEDPQIEEELENPEEQPTPVPVATFTLPSIDLAATELEVGATILY